MSEPTARGHGELRIVVWGTLDLGKPRNRILLEGLQEAGADVIHCLHDVWSGVEDKSQVSSLFSRARRLLRWLLAYPSLVLRYLRLPDHDVVLIGYLGHIDVLVFWPLARLTNRLVVWDAFLSLYNTVVEDRQYVSASHPVGRALRFTEWLACRASDRIVLDTRAHADYFHETFGVEPERLHRVFVGAETRIFRAHEQSAASVQADAACGTSSDRPVRLLFFGQFIPLHGIGTIVEAARQARDERFEWVLIGRGQEEARIKGILSRPDAPEVQWIPWVAYEELVEQIERADVCLGVFGDTRKASVVIPNKVFQAIAMGKPLITRDSPAMRELTGDRPGRGLYLVPPASPRSLVAAVQQFVEDRDRIGCEPLHAEVRESITPAAVGESLLRVIADVVPRMESRP